MPAGRPAYGLSSATGPLLGQEEFDPVGSPGAPPGPLGKIRETGPCALLAICTLGLYTIYWYYRTFSEMKQHTGRGLGGVWAVLMIVPGIVLLYIPTLLLPFLCGGEVAKMYERRGAPAPVSASTGAWIFLPVVGSIIWWLKVNNALNEYWTRSGQTA
jgi:hypothetical protein